MKAKIEQPEDKIGGFGMFLKRVLPYKGIILQAIAINIVVGLLALTLPIVMQILTDDVLVRSDRQLLMTVGIAVIALNRPVRKFCSLLGMGLRPIKIATFQCVVDGCKPLDLILIDLRTKI